MLVLNPMRAQPPSVALRTHAARPVQVLVHASGPATTLQACTPGALLRAELPNSRVLWMEVRRCKRDGWEVVCDGEVLTLTPHPEGGQPSFSHAGYWPRVSDSWVKGVPGLVPTLTALRKQQQASASLPSMVLHADAPPVDLHIATSLQSLEKEVAATPGLWCDGAGPNDPPPTDTATALLTAGEMSALLQGHRGVCLLQLAMGWDPDVHPPLLRPFVFQLLQRACAHKGVGVLESPAPGGLGGSLVLHAKQQPFKARATFLAKTGVQAGIVADSAYYKLLIGLILGYKEENILHHIESYGGRISATTIQTAQEDLLAMSAAPATLPWGVKGSSR